MDEFPENWADFVCAAKQAFEECKKDLAQNIKSNAIFLEKKAYLESVCKWIESEQSKIYKG